MDDEVVEVTSTTGTNGWTRSVKYSQPGPVLPVAVSRGPGEGEKEGARWQREVRVPYGQLHGGDQASRAGASSSLSGGLPADSAGYGVEDGPRIINKPPGGREGTRSKTTNSVRAWAIQNTLTGGEGREEKGHSLSGVVGELRSALGRSRCLPPRG